MFIALALGLGMTMVLMWLLGFSGAGLQAVRAASYTVCPAGPPACDYSVIQDAVDSAGEGDVIKVAAGTYNEVNNNGGLAQVVYINKSVTIRGGYTTAFTDRPDPSANPTTLDAEGQGRVLYIAGGANPSIEGLQITGGDAIGLSLAWGGGVFINNAAATLNRNLVSGNTADGGGGVFLYLGEGTFAANTIISNTSNGGGGGLSINESVATLSSNTISGNHAGWGGGLSTYKAEVVINNNVISSNSADMWGGGVILTQGDIIFNNNTVSGNVAGASGGGLNLDANSATISRNTIVSNTATDLGGGLFLGNSSDASFINNLIADNQADWQGSGLYIGGSSSSLVHTTITRNTGGDGSGLHIGSGSTVAMTNTILVSQTVGLIADPGTTATLEATLWGSGPWVNGDDWQGGGAIITTDNLWGDPVFVDPDTGDYHIGAGSAAIDKGIEAGVKTDIDFHPRPYLTPDLGSDEYWPPGTLKFIYLPLVLR